jgi:glutathione peroxidase-family protein
MAIYDADVAALDGSPAELGDYEGKALLIVNVASQCGLTPQYAGLQELHEQYADRGFAVLGFPCNQFGAQEPGTPDEIATFCETNYSVTFAVLEDRGERRRSPRALRGAHRARRRRRRSGRHPVELREVSRVAGR